MVKFNKERAEEIVLKPTLVVAREPVYAACPPCLTLCFARQLSGYMSNNLFMLTAKQSCHFPPRATRILAAATKTGVALITLLEIQLLFQSDH